MKKRKPAESIICVVRRADNRMIQKRIRKSVKTENLLQQHFARDPTVYVYRVNVYLKNGSEFYLHGESRS